MTRPNVSFEFFPPKSVEASFRLWDTIQTLAPLDPTFVSVTYGAGGTTRELTHEAVTALNNEEDTTVLITARCLLMDLIALTLASAKPLRDSEPAWRSLKRFACGAKIATARR